MSKHIDFFTEANGLKHHYLDYGGEGTPLLMLHSLSANAYIFHGLIAHGLAQTFRVIVPDLRGRGMSEKSLNGHTMETQSEDLIALLNKLGIEKIDVCGHSFGALLGTYFAANFPERVNRLIILDAAVELNPLTPFLISYSTNRLLRNYTSWDEYVNLVRHAPFMTSWDAAMLPFLRADVEEDGNGFLKPRSSWIDVSMAAAHVFSISTQEWRKYFSKAYQPAMLIQATEPYAHGQHIVTDQKAIETLALMPNCEYIKVDGNHITMLYGTGAQQIVNSVKNFCNAQTPEAVTA
jgi:pimeloyl-ACP methyl ester carboxylesterase